MFNIKKDDFDENMDDIMNSIEELLKKENVEVEDKEKNKKI
jgi:hypothetical protein